jgi:hypothetical protein
MLPYLSLLLRHQLPTSSKVPMINITSTEKITVMRQALLLKGLITFAETIASTSYGFDQLAMPKIFKFTPQFGDVNIDDISARVEVIIPYRLK